MMNSEHRTTPGCVVETRNIPAATNVGRFGYTGQTWLPEVGMWYYKARMYSPTLGRFLQTDLMGYQYGMNWYGYVGADPVNFVDPSGLCAFTTWGHFVQTWNSKKGAYNPPKLVSTKVVQDSPCGGALANLFGQDSDPPVDGLGSDGEIVATADRCRMALFEPGAIETVAFSADFILLIGGTGGIGTFRNTQTNTTGFFTTGGVGAGFSLGGSIQYQRYPSLEALNGGSQGASVNVGLISASRSSNDSGAGGGGGGGFGAKFGAQGNQSGTILFGCRGGQ
jgi:RHS repeat-associated protein